MRLLRSHRRSVILVQGTSDMFWLYTTRFSSVTLRKSLSIIYGHSRECNCGHFSLSWFENPRRFEDWNCPRLQVELGNGMTCSGGIVTKSWARGLRLTLSHCPFSVGFTLVPSHLQKEVIPGIETLRIFKLDGGICWHLMLRFTMLQHCYKRTQFLLGLSFYKTKRINLPCLSTWDYTRPLIYLRALSWRFLFHTNISHSADRTCAEIPEAPDKLLFYSKIRPFEYICDNFSIRIVTCDHIVIYDIDIECSL
jgi:hypothetical protein